MLEVQNQPALESNAPSKLVNPSQRHHDKAALSPTAQAWVLVAAHVLEDELAQHEHAPGVRPRGDLVKRRDVGNAVEIGDDRRVVRVCTQPNDSV